MRKDEQTLIEDLVNQLEPNRFWSSSSRSVIWFVSLLLLNILGFLLYQNFRPDFEQEVLTHPRFLFELFTAFGLILLIFNYILIDIVPGKSFSQSSKIFTLLFFVCFSYTLYLSFQTPSPERSLLGARRYCLEETLAFGFIGSFTCLYFLRKSDYPFSRSTYLLIGMGTMLIPGTLMQMACMYSPLHGLLIHYGPALVGLFFGLIFSLFAKTRN